MKPTAANLDTTFVLSLKKYEAIFIFLILMIKLSGSIESLNKEDLMKNTFKMMALLILLTPLASQAFIEARLTYGGLGAKDFASDACGNLCTSSNIPAVVPFVGTGADVIVKIPFIPFGFGVRYEKIGIGTNSSTIEVSANIERVAGIINYRIIDTIIHAGPIATLGLSTKSQLKVTESGTPRVNYDSTTADSASVGFELGIKPLIIIPISVGAEAGYEILKIKNAKDSINNTTKDLDLSGTYLKVFLGLDF